MTKFQKQMLTIAAAGALTAVTALPAMAFENEFHGSYTFKTFFSNFDKGDASNPLAVASTGKLSTWKSDNQMNNYMEQRARIQYIAKASDDLKLVSQFEFNTRFGKVTSTIYGTKGDGGGLDTDGMNIWTKHMYLDFNVGQNFNVKTGLMPYKDTIKGAFVDADVPAVYTTTKLGAYTLGLGFSRFNADANEQTRPLVATRLGDKSTDLFIMDNTLTISKDTKAALSYYYLADYTTDQALLLNTLGLSGETKVGPIALSGFAAIQAGHKKGTTYTGTTAVATTGKNTYFHGYALNAAAKMNVGSSTARMSALFLSGQGSSTAGSAQYGGWVSSGVISANESGVMLIARNTAAHGTNTDNFIKPASDFSNLALLSMGYDANLTEKLYANSTVAFAFAPKSAAYAPAEFNKGQNGSDFLGTELNTEIGYKLYKNLTLKAQAAYMILGGYYKGSAANNTATSVKDPENPYLMAVAAAYTF